MNVLVTGCHGFVGHNVCKALLGRGFIVIGTDRLNGALSYKAHRVKEIQKAGLTYVETSLADYRDVSRIFGTKIDAIFHLAAQFPVQHNRQTLGQYIDSNVKALCNIFELAKEHNVKRVVYSSSVAARTMGKPTSMYGATKRFGEEVAHIYSRFGIEAVVLRIGAVYGPMMRTDAGLWKVANMVLGGRRLPMMTGFRSKHEMIYIDDLANCLAAFATVKLPERYFLETICAHDFAADFGDVAKIVGKIVGKKPVLPAGYTPAARERMCDMSAIEKVTGLMPATKLDAGLAKLVEFIR